MKYSLSFIFIITAIFCFMTSCSSASKSKDGIEVSYEEFQKILNPKSITILEGQNAFLTVMAMPGDKYPNIYRYDMKDKKFKKDYDHGQTINALTYDRTGKTVYVLIDNKGDENYGIYTYNPQKKSVTPFFVKPGFKSYIIDSDKSGKTIFIGSNYENKAVYSIYKLDVGTQKMERITDGKINLMGGLVSPSGNKIATIRPLSNNENQVFLIDTKTKKMISLFKQKNSIFYPSYFNKNEKSLIGISDYRKDRQGCATINLSNPNKISYLITNPKKDISCNYSEWANIYYINEDARGKSTLKLYKDQFKEPIKVPSIFNNQSVTPVAFDRVTNNFLLLYSAANSPGTLYNYDLKTANHQKILDYNISSIKTEQMATSYDFDYKSFDGMDIHGIIYAKPEWLTSGKKYPLIVWPHGGPDSFETHNFRGIFQFLSLNGFVVFAPNYRGSSGYGKKFETLNDKDWGGGHIRDVVVGKNKISQLPYVDKNNVFLLGGSFGGYSTLAAVTFHPKEFKAAVGVVAIGNLFTFMKSIPPDEAWQSEFKREIGDPVKDKKLYKERSPFFHVNNIQIPLQIYQAENDVRTVKAEMDTFVAELRKKGKPVDYTVLKDVGHGLETPKSRKQVYEGSVKFFKSKLTL